MRSIIGLGLAATLLAGAPALAQDGPVVMQPSSNWTADFGDHYCALRREFAGDGATMFMELAKLAPEAAMRLTLASNTLAASNNEPSYAFAPVTLPVTPDIFERVVTDSGYNGVIFTVSLVSTDGVSPAQQLLASQAFAANVESLEMSGPFVRAVELQTGSLGQAMEVMQTCTDDLVSSWGLDPEQQRQITRAASFESDASWLDRYFTASHALEQEHGLAVLRLQLVIDADGRATWCQAYQLPEAQRMDNAACAQVLENARFEPALDAAGAPVASALHFDVARFGGSEYRPLPDSQSNRNPVRNPAPETGAPR